MKLYNVKYLPIIYKASKYILHNVIFTEVNAATKITTMQWETCQALFLFCISKTLN